MDASEIPSLADVRRRTAEAFGISFEATDYITEELLSVTPIEVTSLGEIEWGDEIEQGENDNDAAGVVPNRIWFISDVVRGWNGNRNNIMFSRECDRSRTYLMWDDQYSRWESAGRCLYSWRYKLWFRA